MSAALTFGSVGDIIALCGLAMELGKALNSTRGSAREYQALRKDIALFVQVLVQVIATYEQCERSPWMDGLSNVAKSVVDECSALIGEVLTSVVKRYGESLGQAGSGNRVKDAYRKLEFSVREKEKIGVLQESLGRNVARLSLLNSCADLRSARVDNATLIMRVEEVKELVGKQDRFEELTDAITRVRQHQQNQGRQQKKQLCRVKEQLTQQSRTSLTTLTAVQGMSSEVSEMKQMLASLGEAVVHYRAISTNHRFFNYPTTGSVAFKDVFGQVDPLPLGWVDSWEGFQSLLEHRYKRLAASQVYGMIVSQGYLLQDSDTGRMVGPDQRFAEVFRPGKKVEMGLGFYQGTVMASFCLRECQSICLSDLEIVEGATGSGHDADGAKPTRGPRSGNKLEYEDKKLPPDPIPLAGRKSECVRIRFSIPKNTRSFRVSF